MCLMRKVVWITDTVTLKSEAPISRLYPIKTPVKHTGKPIRQTWKFVYTVFLVDEFLDKGFNRPRAGSSSYVQRILSYDLPEINRNILWWNEYLPGKSFKNAMKSRTILYISNIVELTMSY